MPKFIEVHSGNVKVLINLLWVEEILETPNGKADIYFAFNAPDCYEQDNLTTDESYSEVLKMIWA